jgi:photosystem II stability/assembly factor-like uncharacterized protein
VEEVVRWPAHGRKPIRFTSVATGGGVFKTTDGGSNWSNISDKYFGGSIGAVSVANPDRDIIWVGEGEQTMRGNVSEGHGIWKSD